MIRRYVDKTNVPRRLKFLKGGDFIHWSQEHPACWSTHWLDLDDGHPLRIPNNAWACLKISFTDEHDDEEIKEFEG